MIKLMLGIVLTAVSSITFGQKEVLSNKEIMAMTEAGLPAIVIVRKINTSQSRFDTSASALIELKRARVADDVISAMIDRQELLPPSRNPDDKPAFSGSGSSPNTFITSAAPAASKRELLLSAKTTALAKSSAHPSRQALEKGLLKRADFRELNLAITRYKDTADLYVEIGYVSLSWLTYRYVYRVYDRRSGTILIAGETTSWGSLAANLAGNISKQLNSLRRGV